MSRGILPLYDETLSGILNREGQIGPFLDVFFGFLYRKTDFFKPLSPDGKTGFPVGVAENLVKSTYKRYEKMASREETPTPPKVVPSQPPIIQIAEVQLEEGANSPETGEIRAIPTITAHHADDPGNGAVHDKFSWNQTIHDLDVKIYVPRNISKSKQLSVELTKTTLKVSTKHNNESLLEGKFNKAIDSAESMWILVPGEYIQMTLEKEQEEWWNCLLEGEGKINLDKINAEISFLDMRTEEQQMVRKMMTDQQLKAQGKPTTDQILLAEKLQAGWNAEGSLFRGTPYDPNVINSIGTTASF